MLISVVSVDKILSQIPVMLEITKIIYNYYKVEIILNKNFKLLDNNKDLRLTDMN